MCHLKHLHAFVTAKLLAVSMLSTCGTRLKGASVALGLVLWRKIASRNAVYSWSVFLMNSPPGERDRGGGEGRDGREEEVSYGRARGGGSGWSVVIQGGGREKGRWMGGKEKNRGGGDKEKKANIFISWLIKGNLSFSRSSLRLARRHECKHGSALVLLPMKSEKRQNVRRETDGKLDGCEKI